MRVYNIYIYIYIIYIKVQMGENWPETPSAEHMIEFTLKVKCTHNTRASKGSHDPEQLYLNSQGEHAFRIRSL